MGSSFSSLNAALTGLYAAQRLVEVSGHNIENMNTPGYTRQRVSQKALGISSTPSIFSGSVPQGGGVQMERLMRCGDIFLDAKLRLETGRAAAAKEVATTWKNIESAMDELSNRSVSRTLTEFYKSWGDVNNSSDNNGARSTVLGKAQAMVDQIAGGYTRVNDLWKNGRAQVDALVSEVNTAMDSIAALNERIRREKASGADVNELIDQRAQLVLRVSELTGATGREREDGTMEVMLAGNSMVGKGYVNHFKAAGSMDMPGIDMAPREKYNKALHGILNLPPNPTQQQIDDAIKDKFSETVMINGVKVQRFQPTVGADANGKEYVAFLDYGAAGGTPQIVGTKTYFKLSDFQRDEGPVRITWATGSHQVVLDEGRLGGLMKNLAPATRPHVPSVIGKGGSFAEVGQLYNDLALRMSSEVNHIHAARAGNDTRTLKPEAAHFYEIDLATGEKIKTGSPAVTAPPVANVPVNGQPPAAFQDAVNKQLSDLETANPGKAYVYEIEMKQGGNVFDFAPADNARPPALRLGLVIDDPAMLAAGQLKNGTYDGSVAYKLSKAQDDPDSSIHEWSKSVVDVGVHTRGANDKADLTEQTRRIAERAHKSATGVEMNEEVVNLIQGQHAYAGAARVMSTVNQMLDDLINIGRR